MLSLYAPTCVKSYGLLTVLLAPTEGLHEPGESGTGWGRPSVRLCGVELEMVRYYPQVKGWWKMNDEQWKVVKCIEEMKDRLLALNGREMRPEWVRELKTMQEPEIQRLRQELQGLENPTEARAAIVRVVTVSKHARQLAEEKKWTT
jgi:hypothetical protein